MNKCEFCGFELTDNCCDEQQSVEEYQGWSNVQTWCVVNTFNNTKELQNLALKITREHHTDETIELSLKSLARKHNTEIHDFAPWVWDYLQAHHKWTHDVNWKEIREHYQAKIKDGA